MYLHRKSGIEVTSKRVYIYFWQILIIRGICFQVMPRYGWTYVCGGTHKGVTQSCEVLGGGTGGGDQAKP